jgi:hypothetical protein
LFGSGKLTAVKTSAIKAHLNELNPFMVSSLLIGLDISNLLLTLGSVFSTRFRQRMTLPFVTNPYLKWLIVM